MMKMKNMEDLELEKRDVEVRYVKERHPVRNFLINIILFMVAFYISMPILAFLLNSCAPVN